MNRIGISSQSSRLSQKETEVRHIARAALRALAVENASLDIFLVTQKEIQKINKECRGKDAPTNVLSFVEAEAGAFPVVPRENSRIHLGEIYLSPDFIRLHNQSLHHMVVHGILHLLGYDHMNARDAKKMEALEDMIMREKFGYVVSRIS